MKKNILKLVLIVVVIAICFVFSADDSFLFESTQDKLSDMTVESFSVTIDEEENIITIENLIKARGASYGWTISNTVLGSAKSIETATLEALETMEFSFEDYTSVSFQSHVNYDGNAYSSTCFYIDEDGLLYESEKDLSGVVAQSTGARDISDIVSIAFVMFLLITVFVYYTIGKKIQWVILLAASVFFFLLSGVQYILFIFLSSLIVFLCAKKMSKNKVASDLILKDAPNIKAKKLIKGELQKKNKFYLSLALIGSLGVMAVIKYTSFLILNINAVFNLDIEFITLLMPLGLSFYTFILIAYTMDVYRGKYLAQSNFAKFFLFASFFPQVSQGPIARYDELSPQFNSRHKFDSKNFAFSAQRILWGFFIKLVLADRIAIFVDGVYNDYSSRSWLMLVLASLAYSIQIYADFYSSMEIAIGSAQMFNIKLSENFLRPYFSRNMPEFWRRWHATLGSWFKDYVFYPVSISKVVMKYSVKIRRKFGPNVARVVAAIPPIMGVWALTGLWHGSSWKFIAWGLFHGFLILLSTAFSPTVDKTLNKIGIKTKSWAFGLIQMAKVFILCTIGRVFFRASSFTAAIKIFWYIITFTQGDGLINIESINLISLDYYIIYATIAVFLIVGILQEKFGSVRTLIAKSNICIRWLIWLALIVVLVMYGKYGADSVQVFLYEAF